MTIKELEEAVGMTRANIRFYEQEGLISPVRGENGYRDYSPADVETLEKIKLLRELHLGLDTIRALQKGETSLPAALDQQLRRLAADQEALGRAREVCSRLREQGADYDGLDAKPWLRELERAPAPFSLRYAPPRDEAPPLPGHPWRRYFARMLDMGLYELPFWFVILLRFRLGRPLSVETMDHWLFRLVLSYLGCAVMLLVEPLLLHHWGTTPGKWVFGIKLRQADGEKFTLTQARERTWWLFGKGMGYNIPFYELWRMYKSYKQIQAEERNEWEWFDSSKPERMEIPDSVGRCFAYVGVRILSLALAAVVALQALLPPNRGGLDMAGFCQNYNYYNTITDGSTRYFDDRGGLQTGEPTLVDLVNSTQRHGWSPVVEQGETVGFRYEAVYSDDWFTPGYNLYQQLGTLAFVGALPQINGLNFRSQQWTERLPDDRWNYDYTFRGVHFTQEVHLEGEGAGAVPKEGYFTTEEKTTLFLTFTVRLA